MFCFILKIIYNIFPFTFLRALIIDKHFLTCKKCKKESQLKEIKLTVIEFSEIDIWQGVLERINLSKRPEKLMRRWQLAFIFSIAIVAIGLGLIMYLNTKRTEKIIEKERSYAIVENAYIRGKRAKVYIFKPKEPGISIVWLEPEREVNYK